MERPLAPRGKPTAVVGRVRRHQVGRGDQPALQAPHLEIVDRLRQAAQAAGGLDDAARHRDLVVVGQVDDARRPQALPAMAHHGAERPAAADAVEDDGVPCPLRQRLVEQPLHVGCIAAVGNAGHGRQQAAPRRLDLLVGQPPVDAEQIAHRPRALAPRQADHTQRGAGIARRLDQSLGIDELAVGGRVGIGEGQPQAMHCASPCAKRCVAAIRDASDQAVSAQPTFASAAIFSTVDFANCCRLQHTVGQPQSGHWQAHRRNHKNSELPVSPGAREGCLAKGG